MAGQWTEVLSDELKKLNLIKSPNAKQKARIAELKAIKATGPAGKQKATTLIDPNTKLDTPAQVINTQGEINKEIAKEEGNLNRIDQFTPFGTQEYGVDAEGRTFVKQNLTPGQQGILDSDTAITQMGKDLALENIGGAGLNKAFDPTSQDFRDQQLHYEDAAFKALTRGFDTEKGRDAEALAQSLAESGVHIGDEKYDNAMSDFNTYWGNRYDNAKNDSITQGLNAWANAVDVGAGINNQKINEAKSLSGLGTGLQVPNFFAPGQIDLEAPDVAGTTLGFGTLGVNKGSLALQKQKAGGGGGSGGSSSGGSSSSPSPFNDSFLG